MTGDRHLITASSAVSSPAIDISNLKPLHSGSRHKLYRGATAGVGFVMKMPAAELSTAQAVESMRHEYELLSGLELRGIVRALGLTPTKEGIALLMEDAGSSSLADQIRSQPLSIEDFLEIGVQLAEAVARLHDARIVHRDINPSNIVWDTESRKATLIDFGIAMTLPALTVEIASPNRLEGTLAYISPEQTGRTGHSVDSRTDLYSLGATFYEMLTGRPPFALEDPIELVHAHIARRPIPPHEINPDAQVALSRVVLKLLEKAPERRYQTAQALALDLREARRQWQGTGTILPLQLGRHDVPRELSLPDRLYGRDEELGALREAFLRAQQGPRELLLVVGPPGIGKSALVGQVAPIVSEQRGLYISGKFDQLQRSVPFSGLSQAFRQLARQLLIEGESTLAMWRQRIEEAVAPNGQVLIDIVPELERILGPQPTTPEFGPVESKNRFQLVFTQFLNVFARPEHPLVLFLDDLQWADAASLQLLAHWLADGASRHFLLLGAYRDDEVESSHPLALTLADLRGAGVVVDEIRLGPIGVDDVAQLLAGTLNKEPADAKSLADLITQKTGGNPFFIRRLLHLLHSQQLIRFEPLSQSWAWDLTELERSPLAENVLDLMVQAIKGLPVDTRTLLEMGACVGHRFDLGTLAEVSGLSRTKVTDRLWPALEDGLLLPEGNTYRAPRRPGPLEERLDALPLVVQFAHDRVQQAIYSLLSEERRREIHLSVGRHLLKDAGDGRLDENLFDIVDQLDLGEALIVEPAERLRLAELNLAAGGKARASAAYHAAVEYLTVAMRHLPERAWEKQPGLTFGIHRELAECAYLTGQHGRAEEIIEKALEHASSKIAKADLYSLRVLAATVAADWPQALRWGREGLAVFGQEWPLEGLAEVNEAEAAAVMKNVGARKIEDLREELGVGNEETRACMRLLSILGPPAYFSGADVLTFLVTRATNLSLVHGASVYTAYAYAFYAGLHNVRTGEYGVGYAFGRLALGLARRFGNRAEESRTLEVFGLIVHPWKAPLREGLPLLREGYQAGVESGELAYAAFNLNSLLINGLPAGVRLADLLADAEVAVEFATRYKNRTSLEMVVPFRQFARTLMGQTRTFTTFDDNGFDTARFLEEAKANQTALGFFYVARLQAAYFLGDYNTARQCSKDGEGPVLAGNIGMVTLAEHAFYTALTLAAACPRDPIERTEVLDKLRAFHRQIVSWAEHSPHNFAHKAALVGGEIARLSGAAPEALQLFRTAINGASREFFLQDEALAHELRARLLLSEDEPDFATVHLRAAAEGYREWGAVAKVRALELQYPEVFRHRSASQGAEASIDALALIKGSQAIAAERTPEGLFERILRVVAEVAGAQSGALLLSEHEVLTLHARIEAGEEISASLGKWPLDQCPDLPSSILRYVLRLKEPLILSDATAEAAFAGDPAIRQRKVLSVLCVPLSNQGKTVGLVYLENETMAGAFAKQLVEVVQVLAAQAAISLENNALMGALQSLTAELEERVAERTRQLADEMAARDKAEAALLQAQKMEAMGSLTGGVAHDFNNLLTPIMGSLDMLQRKGIGGERERRLIAGAMQAAERAKTLVQRLLAFARRQPLQTAAVDIVKLVSGMANLIGSVSGPQIKVIVEARDDLPSAQADANQLEMALLNLSVNARDAMPEGGTLRITVTEESVERSGPSKLKPGRYICLSVADNGTGMDEATLIRAVEPFFSTKGVGKGTGLGLSMVHGLASQLGGALTIHSRSGVGTNVELWLPISDAPEQTGGASIEAAPQTAAAGVALLVEDEELVRMSIADMLSDLGYTVVEARSGEEALRLTREGLRPNLLVTDHLMPGINGSDLARLVRLEHPHAQILIVSGYAETEGVAPDLPRLTKPFRGEELAASLAALAGTTEGP